MGEHDKLRTGIIGCGGHGRALATAVMRSESLQLVACADPDRKAAEQVAGLAPDISTHSSFEALLDESEVDAVLIATPHHLLAPAALAALRACKHIMAEKPIALNEQSAAEVEAAAVEAGVRFMAGYSFRFLMARYVQELLTAGAVGEVVAITGAIGMGPLDEDWVAYPETGGGPMLFLGCHLVDLFLWLVDSSPVEVCAEMRLRSDTGADDTTAFQLRFANHALAQGFVTQSAAGFFYQLQVHGLSGMVALRGSTFTHFEIEVSSAALSAYAEPTIIRPVVWPDHISGMLVPELEEFASAIREGRAPAITAADGRRVLQVLDTIAEASRVGQKIALSPLGQLPAVARQP